MKYKEGDTVRIKQFADLERYRGECGIMHDDVTFAEEMKEFCGQELIVKRIDVGEWRSYYKLYDNDWAWYEWMFEENYPNPPVKNTIFVSDFFGQSYMQQLLSAKITKLLRKETKAEAKLYNIRKKLIAYRQLQEKYETTI